MKILVHAADSCFETKNLTDATSGGAGVQTVEKYKFSVGMAGKGLQYLSTLLRIRYYVMTCPER